MTLINFDTPMVLLFVFSFLLYLYALVIENIMNEEIEVISNNENNNYKIDIKE